MNNKKGDKVDKQDKIPPAKWTPDERNKFVESMVHEIQTGNFTDSGFKQASWNRITLQMQNKGCNYGKQQLQNQYSILKAKFVLIGSSMIIFDNINL